MTLEKVAIEESLIEFDGNTVPSDASYGGDIAIKAAGITEILADSVKIKDNISSSMKKVAVGQITWLWSPTTPCPFTSAALYVFVSGASVPPIMISTATATKAENQGVMRENDVGLCVGVWNDKAVPPNAFACKCNVKIVDAKQDSTEAQ